MNITILTYGSQGDVEPFIALGKRLSQAGHRIRLAGPKSYGSRFELGSIDYIPLPGDPGRMVQELADQAGTNYFRMIRSVSNYVFPLAVEVFDRSRAACLEADLIIHSFLLSSTGIGMGLKLGIPTISAQLFPVFSTTSAFPAPSFPDLPLGPIYRRLSHKIVSLTFKWGSRLIYQRLRSKNPILPELEGWIPGDQGDESTPILYGFSPRVITRPGDWMPNAHLTGYWLLEEESQPPAPEALDFMESGPPPITVAFGSTRTARLRDILDIVTSALAHCKQRGIIIGEQLESAYLSSDLLQLSYAPYSWVFQRSAAAIHHGGAGTTARGLLAGVPNIIIPFTSDQPFWGWRVHHIGAGPKPIPARKLSQKKLIEAIDSATNDRKMRERAERIGKQIGQEDGCGQAVQIIDKYLAQF